MFQRVFFLFIQPEEELQPEAGPEVPNDELVEQLVGMGFSLAQCKKAVLATGNKGIAIDL